MKLKLFRSPERDRKTDQDRVAPILAAIDAAVASAEKEREGLKRRYDAEVSRASMLSDTEMLFEGASARPQEHDLRGLEISIASAAARIHALEVDLEKLRTAQRLLAGRPAQDA